MVKLLGESSIGSGVRRVEALVGLDAFRYLAREHVLVHQLAGEFKAPPEELPERIAASLDRLKTAEKELDRLRVGAGARAGAARSRRGGSRSASVQVVLAEAPAGVSGNDLRSLALDVRGRLRRAIRPSCCSPRPATTAWRSSRPSTTPARTRDCRRATS